MKLLVIEDNPRLAERIQRKLYKFHTMDSVNNGHDAIERVKNYEFDLIILDLGLPDMPGIEVCKLFRAQEVNTPILVLTGMDDTPTKVSLLDSGADDYLTKPFDSDELRARISALIRRRSRNKPHTILKHLDLTVDIEQRRVTRADIDITLRRKEFDILEYLIRNTGRVLTRDMIMNHAWDGDKQSWNSTIDVHIKHLRDKIDRPFEIPLIKTAYGLGYKIDSLDKKV